MNKTYQFRLYPTKKQQTKLNHWLALCCEVFNAALQERRDAYRMAGVSLGYSHQCAELPGCKQVRPELSQVNSQVVQDAVKRVDLAFAAFVRRCEAGEKPGYPRFRPRFRYDSLTFKQYGNSFSLESLGKQRGKLILSKIGHVKMVMHRHMSGTPKTAIVKRTPTGKWFVSITCEQVEPITLPPSEERVGIDVGLKYFAYLSTDEHIENPQFFREEEKALGKAQHRLSKAERGTARLLKRFGFIAVEALVVRSMVKNPKLAKSIADAAWSMFFTHLTLKAEEAARCVVKVPPAYTTQACSQCGQRQNIPLSVRVYECPQCGLGIDRDHNASLNILAQAVGRHGGVIPEAPGAQAVGSRHKGKHDE